jgi:hypothetical protein
MNKIIFLTTVILSVLSIPIARATTYYSTGVTDWKWSSTTSWTLNSNGSGNCGCLPTGGDIAIIRSGDSISVPTNINVTGNLTVQVYGVLNITGFLDLNGTASVVNIYPGAHLSSNGSPSSKLRIGGTAGAEYTGNDGTLTGPWTISNGSSASNAPLPVVLTSFSCTSENSYITLNWQTSQEINNSYFEIQKSNDGINFTGIGKVTASASDGKNSLHAYSYTDAQASTKNNYYRLRQIDIDGNFSYSEIIENQVNDEFDFTLYPNPSAGNNFDILFNSLQNNLSLTLLNFQGKEICSKIISLNDENTLTGNGITTNINPGIYFIIVSSDKKTIRKKLVVQ